MLCGKCHKNLATLRYAEVIDGDVTERHVCESCMEALQDLASGFDLVDQPEIAHAHKKADIRPKGQHADRVCIGCGESLMNVHERGLVGCIQCYDAFGNQIEAILEGLHNAAAHKGKNPRLDDNRARIRADLQNKRALLRSVLRTENYEDAARLRDEIKSLESGLLISERGAD